MQLRKFRLAGALAGILLVAIGCGSSSSSGSSAMPPSAGNALVRFVEGAPELEALEYGLPQDMCPLVSAPCYLQVDGQTVATSFIYGTFTRFLYLSPGTHSLLALDESGYRVGPIKTTSLAAGKDYTLILVGTYPNYRVLTFEEPASQKGNVQLSLYEASPSVASADFGSFAASSHSGFKQLGSAALGSVATVSLGSSVSDFGGYVGHGTKPFAKGHITLKHVDSFDKKNVLPFHNATRFSLFLFDKKTGTSQGPVFGSLDR